MIIRINSLPLVNAGFRPIMAVSPFRLVVIDAVVGVGPDVTRAGGVVAVVSAGFRPSMTGRGSCARVGTAHCLRLNRLILGVK